MYRCRVLYVKDSRVVCIQATMMIRTEKDQPCVCETLYSVCYVKCAGLANRTTRTSYTQTTSSDHPPCALILSTGPSQTFGDLTPAGLEPRGKGGKACGWYKLTRGLIGEVAKYKGTELR